MYKSMLAHDGHHRKARGDGGAALCVAVLIVAGCCAVAFRRDGDDPALADGVRDGEGEAGSEADEHDASGDDVAASGLYCFLTRSSLQSTVRPVGGSPDGSGDEEWVVVDSDAAEAGASS